MIKPLLRCAALGALSIAAQAADFSYYMLELAYVPNLCVKAGAQKDPGECAAARRLGFVVHSLSPQTTQGNGPTRCAPAKPLPPALVRSMLNYIPSESLVQQAWAAHGTCSGLSAEEYFALVRRVRDSLRIPAAFEDVRRPLQTTPDAVTNDFSQTNPGLRPEGFRVGCFLDGLLENVKVCFDKKGLPQACTGAAQCTKLRIGMAQMPPPRLR
jgi:ribonuclease T2